jgi:hypothetical protein
MAFLSNIITPTNIVTASSTTTLTNKTIGVTQLSGSVAVANGGTGSSSLTTDGVLLGNSTSALKTVSPGTSGNVLTSDGTTWSSVAPTAGVTNSKSLAYAIVLGF